MKYQTAPGFGPAGRRRLEIRQVWARNAEQEFALIRHAAEYFPYVSVDTEFPGVVHFPNAGKFHADLTPAEAYAGIKANVDALHLIQVGLTFAASPAAPPAFAFQINLREFDPAAHPHNRSSVDMLTDHGLDLAAHRAHGVEARVLAALLMSSGLVCPGRGGNKRGGKGVTWVAFSAGYDLGYLLRLLMGRDLPGTLPEFLTLVRVFFGDKLYDVKHIHERCLKSRGLPGGLEKLAAALGVAREAGTAAHQAGSDSALTWAVFRHLRVAYFAKTGVRGFAGVVHGLDLHPTALSGSSDEEKSQKGGYGWNGRVGGYNKLAHNNGGNGNGNGNGIGNGRRHRRKVSPAAAVAALR